MKGTTNRITPDMKENILSLYKEGKMDSEIAKELNVSRSAILYWRKQWGLESKFDYSKISKIDNKQFEELFNRGLSDYKIAKILKMSPDGIYSHRMRHNFFREDLRENKAIELSDFQKQVLIGTLLGDSSFKMGKGSVNPEISCAHGLKQEDYCKYKTKIFENLGAKCTYHKRNIVDKRTNILCEDYTMFVPANPLLRKWYDQLYLNNKKVIPMNLVSKYFTNVSLAFLFMDDGTKLNKTYDIATNCFQRDNIKEFEVFLKNKFNLNTTLFKSNVMYIKRDSAKLFTSIVSPYICQCMKYKLL